MPTPTPVPSNQIVQAVQASQNIIDNAVQQGIVGVLQLLAIGVVLYLILQLAKTYFQRNVKPDNSGLNEVLKTMADGNIRSSEREDRAQETRRQEREEWRKQILDRDEQFREAVIHLGDGYNRMGDILERQVTLQEAMEADHRLDVNTITAMKADIGQMVNVGSVPLRGLIDTVARIETSLQDIKGNLLPCADIMGILDENKRLYEEGLQALKADVEVLKRNMHIRIEEKRKLDTSELKPVNVTVNTSNVLPDSDASAAAGEAA